MIPDYLRERSRRILRPSLPVTITAGILLAACGQEVDVEHSYPASINQRTSNNTAYDTSGRESVFGGEGISLFGGGGDDAEAAAGGGGVAVNSFLWRASLDTMSFMPLASADPFGGVIITDWYTPPETPQERFKANVYILGRQLRADGVRVAIFKQRKDPVSGAWVAAPVSDGTATEIENKILTRARELRVATRVQ